MGTFWFHGEGVRLNVYSYIKKNQWRYFSKKNIMQYQGWTYGKFVQNLARNNSIKLKNYFSDGWFLHNSIKHFIFSQKKSTLNIWFSKTCNFSMRFWNSSRCYSLECVLLFNKDLIEESKLKKKKLGAIIYFITSNRYENKK